MAGRLSGATEQALALIENGENPYAAAKLAGISPSTIYRALARIRKEKAAKQRRGKKS